jgi:hypothetical protein
VTDGWRLPPGRKINLDELDPASTAGEAGQPKGHRSRSGAPPGTAPGRRRDDGGPSSSSTSPTKNKHISYEEQGKRLQDRLDRPDKRWKLSRSDVSERGHWADYAGASRDAIAETSTKSAPWYVTASDHKWFRNWEVSKILVDVLDAMDPRYPEPPPLEGVTFT